MTRQYRSEALATGHETGLVLAETDLLSKQTMRRFDEICPSSMQDMTPHDIRALRLREQASQAVFARHLDMATGPLRKWKRGEKRPSGASEKFLTLVA